MALKSVTAALCLFAISTITIRSTVSAELNETSSRRQWLISEPYTPVSSSSSSLKAVSVLDIDEAKGALLPYSYHTSFNADSTRSFITADSLPTIYRFEAANFNRSNDGGGPGRIILPLVRSAERAGNLAIPAGSTFTTLAPPDTTPPVISAVRAKGLTVSLATLRWTTNEASDGQVEFGMTTSYGGLTSLNTSMVTNHSANLSGLAANTLYHYRARSADGAGNLAMSPDSTFTTLAPPDTTPPLISGVGASGVTVSLATLSWTTNEVSNGQVEFGTTTSYGGLTSLNTSMVTSHSANLSGLGTSTLYHYRVRSTDGAGNLAMSPDSTFTTLAPPDTTPPLISGVGASGVTVSLATLSWTTNEVSNGQVEFGTTTSYGSLTSLNTSLVTSHSANLSGLGATTLYHYRVRSADGAGNLAMSPDSTFTTLAPPDTTPPVISGVGASGLTASLATLSWTTNEVSDTQVEFGTTTSYGSLTSLNTSLVISHSANLSGLAANTLYHYRARSADGAGNLAMSPDSTFTTLAPPDTTPPVISGVGASAITSSLATLSWTTNEVSNTQVEFGTTTSYGGLTTLNTSLVTSHSANLSGLATSTLYHYRVRSADGAGNLAMSPDSTFTTLAPPDTTPPVISGVGASGLTASLATLSWTTNEVSDTQVEFGTTTSYGSLTSLNTSLVISHSANLSGLAANTLYHYRARSADGAGNLAMSPDSTFTTLAPPDTTPPVISGVSASAITASLATLSWTTNEVSNTQVEFGTTTSYGGLTSLNTSMVTSHSANLSGLATSTLYHYRVRSADGAGNLAMSPDSTFTTLAPPDTTPPVISGVAASGITSSLASLSWTTNEVSNGQVEFGSTISYGSLTSLNTSLVTSHSANLSGLATSTLYHYRVRSSDGAGNLAMSPDSTFTTLIPGDTTPPVISGVSASGITTSLATISWTTNEASDSQVEFGTTTSYGSLTSLNTSLVTSHSANLSGLGATALYHYRVRSADGAGNLAMSPDSTFTTLAPPDTTPPVISGVSASGITTSLATISWTTNEASDSQVEFGTTTSYGSLTSSNSSLVTSHSANLSGLAAITLYHYRVRSQDAAGNPGLSGDFTFATPSGGGVGLPELPRVFLNTDYSAPTGNVITVNAGGDLQAAINAAQPGDQIVVQAGATFTGNLTLPNKTGSGWIYIRTSNIAGIPGEGTRVSPLNWSAMPKIFTANSSPAIQTLTGAHHYRLVGLEVGVTSTNTTNYNVIELGSDETALGQLPTNIVIDRCYIHGNNSGYIRRGIALNSASSAVIDSHLSNFHDVADSQAILGWNGTGPFKIVNNYLEAAGENVLFGGNDPSIPNLVPSDIEIRRNHFYKPLSWRPLGWTEKNLFELKIGRRVLVDGNVFENSWVDGQTGHAIVITPRNQYGGAPWTVVEDVTFTNNIVRHAAGVFDILGYDDIFPTQQTRRILIKDNLFDDINGPNWGGGFGQFAFLLDGVANVTIDHNSSFQSEHVIYSEGRVHPGFVFTNNIMPHNNYGVIGAGVGVGLPALNTYFPAYVFARNAIVSGAPSSYPPNNFFPFSLTAVGFVDFASGNFRLASSSPYRNAGTDGSDLGANINAVEAATAGCITGVWP